MDSTDLTAQQIKSKRSVYLAFATLGMLVLGLIYAWSILAIPISEAYPNYEPVLSVVFQVSLLCFALSALVGGQIIKRSSAKTAVILGGILMGAGLVLTAFAANIGLWVLIIFYGILGGAGCGIAYTAIISLVYPWFSDRLSFCAGVQMMGFGLSALVFGCGANAMFNIMDWHNVLLIIAVVGFAVLLLLAVIVKPAPADIIQKLGLGEELYSAQDTPTQQESVLRTRTFWSYSVWATVVVACGISFIGTAAQYPEVSAFAAQIGLPMFPALLVGLVSFINGLSRVVNGVLFSRVGLKPVMLLSAATVFIGMVCMIVALVLQIGGLLVVAGVLVGFAYGSVPVMASAYAIQRHGVAGYNKNVSIVNCNLAFAAVLNIIILVVFGSPTAANGPLIYGILAVLSAIAFLDLFIFSRLYKADWQTIIVEL